MRVSTKGRYGLRVMIGLAQQSHGGAVSLKDIASQQEISEKYLWQIVRLLTAADLISATRGAQGGYRLSRPAKEITFQEIYSALEGPCRLVPCTESSARCRRSENCPARGIWREVEETISEKMRSLTLDDILKRSPSPQERLMYAI